MHSSSLGDGTYVSDSLQERGETLGFGSRQSTGSPLGSSSVQGQELTLPLGASSDALGTRREPWEG